MTQSLTEYWMTEKSTAGHAPPRAKAPGIPLPLLPKQVLKKMEETRICLIYGEEITILDLVKTLISRPDDVTIGVE